MFLAIDISYNAIKFAIIDDNSYVKLSFDISLSEEKTSDQYAWDIEIGLSVNKIDKEKIYYIGILSVIPKVEKEIIGMCRKVFNIIPIIVDKSMMDIDYSGCEDIPTDMLVSSYFAYSKFKFKEQNSSERRNIILVDFSYITSVIAVSLTGKIVGFTMFPGPEMSSSVIRTSTPNMPEVGIEVAEDFVKKTIHESINIGIFNQQIFTCDGIIEGIKSTLDGFAKNSIVVSTGYNSKLFSSYSNKINEIDNSLKINGIFLLSKNSIFI